MFGADRCMLSSNFPVDKAGFGYGTVWNMFKRIAGGSSSDERAVIFKRHREARLYRKCLVLSKTEARRKL